MKWNGKSRRFFLQGAAGTMLALPFLESVRPKEVKAGAAPRSFIGIGAWNGAFRMYGPNAQLMPKTPEQNGSLVGLTKVNTSRHAIHHGSLSALAAANDGRISDVIDESYTPYLQKMMMLQGLDYIGLSSNHHSGQFGNWNSFGADAGNPDMASLDVVLANYFAGQGMPGDMVAYSASGADNDYGCSFNADGSNTTSRFDNPATLWEKYFGNAQIPANFKELLVDRVLEDYKALKNNKRLGTEDRHRVDAHVEHLAVTEEKLKNLSAVCQQTQPIVDPSDRRAVLRSMNDVIVGLIACGMCNSFMGWAQALLSENPDSWHVWSHAGYDNDNDQIADADAYASLVDQSKAVMDDMCLDLVQKLDALEQLDNCLVACVQEHNKRGHECWNVPVITFGSAGGTLKTNQYVDFRNIADRDDEVFSRFGYPMNQLYANILMSMGMPAGEFEALNKPRSDGAGSPFKSDSGYGVNAIHPEMSGGSLGDHYGSWSGHDMSAWLPQLKA